MMNVGVKRNEKTRAVDRVRALGIVPAVILIFLFEGGCHRDPHDGRPIAFQGETMGTTYTIKIASLPGKVSEEKLHALVDAELERINDLMSTYRPDSEISRFNRHDRADWFPVSHDLALVVEAAQSVSRKTEGAFDITVGPLVDLWGFGAKGRHNWVPEKEAIRAVRDRTGNHFLHARTTPPAFSKDIADLEIDLSAIAKGYAVDRVAVILAESGATGFLVEIGGDLRAGGAKSDGSAWRIGVETPGQVRTDIEKTIALRDKALATSGDYRNYFEEKGVRYSHIIDPRTGSPATHRLASVTVVADDCMTADGWATALLVLGPEEGLALAEGEGMAAYFIVRKAEGFATEETAAFSRLTTGHGK